MVQHRHDAPSPEDLYADHLARNGEAADIERLLREHPEHVAELRVLDAEHDRVRAVLSRGLHSTWSPEDSLAFGFEVKEEIGRGSFGRVFRAFDLGLEREVALKMLDEGTRLTASSRERFVAEARVLAKLDHPNIVRIYSVGEDGGRPRIAMELVSGQTLADLVRRDGPLAAEEAARIGCDLCRALAAIHARGLVHMDLKPGNVMRAEGGRIVLLDFGLARASAGLGEGPLGGTPHFCAPEQLEGLDTIGPATDVYALGITLYWLVSGRFPFQAEDFAGLRRAVLQDSPRPLLDVAPDVPAEFAAIASRSMKKDPKERFASAGSLEEALRSFLAGRGVRSVRPRRARTVTFAAVSVLLLAGVLGLARWSEVAAVEPPHVQFDVYAVRGSEDVLLARDGAVRTGEHLYMEVRADEPIYLYVFNEDLEGKMFTLFPEPRTGLANPLSIEGSQRLPPDTSWEANTPGGGAEFFHVVAATSPVPFAQELASQVERVAYRDLPEEIRGGIERGFGVHDTPAETPGAGIATLAELLEEARTKFPGVYIETFRLEHP